MRNNRSRTKDRKLCEERGKGEMLTGKKERRQRKRGERNLAPAPVK